MKPGTCNFTHADQFVQVCDDFWYRFILSPEGQSLTFRLRLSGVGQVKFRTQTEPAADL